MKKLPEESRADETLIPVISLWRHEMHRIIRDRSSPIFSLWFVCFQLLRQLLDDKILCKLQKPFEMKTVEGLSIISAMSMSEQASVSSRQLSDRLLVSSIHHLDCPNIKDLEITFSNLFLFFALNWSIRKGYDRGPAAIFAQIRNLFHS